MTNTFARTLHDVGLAGWFGGTLANAVALNPAAAQAEGEHATGAVANTGWDRWTPVNAAAIGAHVTGAAILAVSDSKRVAGQKGQVSAVLAKTVLTAAALGVTAYSRAIGRKVSEHKHVPAESGTEPSDATPTDVAKAQKQLKALQWAVPAVTGALVAVTSYVGEQQRPSAVKAGVLGRLTPG